MLGNFSAGGKQEHGRELRADFLWFFACAPFSLAVLLFCTTKGIHRALQRPIQGGRTLAAAKLRSFTGRSNSISAVVLTHGHQNDFCDLKLRCASRRPEVAWRQEEEMLQCDFKGCDAEWLAICDLELRFCKPKSHDFLLELWRFGACNT